MTTMQKFLVIFQNTSQCACDRACMPEMWLAALHPLKITEIRRILLLVKWICSFSIRFILQLQWGTDDVLRCYRAETAWKVERIVWASANNRHLFSLFQIFCCTITLLNFFTSYRWIDSLILDSRFSYCACEIYDCRGLFFYPKYG